MSKSINCCIVICFCILILTSCNADKQATGIPILKDNKEQDIYEDGVELSNEMINIFNKAQQNYDDMYFIPLRLLSNFDLKGNEFRFLCTEDRGSFQIFASDYIVTIVKYPDDIYKIINVQLTD